MALTDNARATLVGLNASIVQAAAQLAALAEQLADIQTVHDAEIRRRDDRIHELEQQSQPEPVTRFPGDPGPGRIAYGCSKTSNGDITPHETATGRPLPLRRRFYAWNAWQGADSKMIRAIKEDHAAGRRPWVSFKAHANVTGSPYKTPDEAWQAIADGALDSDLAVMWETVIGLGREVIVTFHHEPEGDGTAAKYRAAQARVAKVRADVTARLGGNSTATYAGILMAYTGNPASGRDLADWYPGGGVWDVFGVDHYVPQHNMAMIREQLLNCYDFATAHGLPIAVGEHGVRADDPDGPAKMVQLYEWGIEVGMPFCSYFDSDVNSTGDGWNLAGDELEQFYLLLLDPRTIRI
jgi:hypothetical protein